MAGQQVMMAQQQVDRAMTMFGRADAGRALLIHSSKQEPGVAEALEEDLSVMSRILEKTIARESSVNSPDRAMGIFVYSQSGRSPQNIYLEGYGVLFLVNARFPLVAAPQRDQAKGEKHEDSSWEEAKREIYGGRTGPVPGMDYGMGGMGRPAQMEFDPEKVEGLKKDLISALKNASNIRNLKHDDNVVIVVSSPDGGRFEQRLQGIVRTQTPLGDRPGEDSGVGAPGKPEPKTKIVRGTASAGAGGFRVGGVSGGHSSTMTIRAKKSDVDSFAAGKMDFDDFRKKVSVVAY